jgi:hypothetical protein
MILVTAKHVAKELHAPFVVRMNKKGGGARLLHFERPEDIEWCFHPTDDAVDIAAAPIEVPSWADQRGYLADGVLKTDAPQIAEIGPGDHAWVVGLFHLHKGEKANLPIVHSGNVAMLPGDELIPVDGKMVEGYLVQANAISGCSGSPVFATRTLILKNADGVPSVAAATPTCTLIGVWSSSWKVSQSSIVAVRNDNDDGSGKLAPLGMGVVTPASKLADILRGEELMSAVQNILKRRQQRGTATPDSLATAVQAERAKGEPNPNHKEAFTSLLNAASKKSQPAD